VTYRALPDGLFISDSPIAGQGIFTRRPLESGTVLGLSHIILGEEIIRTPLGGFINHSDHPNCAKYEYEPHRYFITVLEDIDPMKELFLKYTFYEV
tara:strand:- start:106 stop:393 length:288 start_codon:yes stop_codon:yes gene_type:complete